MIWLIYAASVLDDLNDVLILFSIMCLIAWLFYGFNYLESKSFPTITKNKEEKIALWSFFKHKLVIISCSLLFFSVFVPSEKTLYMMIGAHYSEKVFDSDESKKIADKIIKVIELKLDEQIEKSK